MGGSDGGGEGGGVEGGGGGSDGGGGGGSGGEGGGGVEGGALVSITVWTGSVTARLLARSGTALASVLVIMVASTVPAWAWTWLLWSCRAV